MTHPITDEIIGRAKKNATSRPFSTKLKSQVVKHTHAATKKKNLAKIPTKVVSGAARSLIPFVGGPVASGINKTHSVIERKVLNKSHADKARRYENEPLKRFKFQLKDLGVDGVGDSVKKARKAIDKFTKADEVLLPTPGLKSDLCETLLKRSYKFYRMQHRLNRLQEQIEGILEILNPMLLWTDEALHAVNILEKSEKNLIDHYAKLHEYYGEELPTKHNTETGKFDYPGGPVFGDCGSKCVVRFGNKNNVIAGSKFAEEAIDFAEEQIHTKTINEITNELIKFISS